MNETEQIVSLSDVARRWNVSRQYVQHLYKSDKQFPEVYTTVKAGLQPLFKLSDIKDYEPSKNMPKGDS